MKILSEKEAVPDAVQILRQPGSVLLVPTETVYGLVCAWEDTAARKRIYELKHRSENKPFAAFIPCVDALPPEATLPDAARKIAEAFCPGPAELSDSGFRITRSLPVCWRLTAEHWLPPVPIFRENPPRSAWKTA